MFSKACEYGIRAVLYIATCSLEEKRVSLKDIAREIDSPVAFTAKILQQLSKAGVINSTKGPNGGFEIERNALDKIGLIDIVIAIDGDGLFKGCGLGLKECNEAFPCPVHHEFKAIRDNLEIMLSSTSIFDMATSLNEGKTYLKR